MYLKEFVPTCHELCNGTFLHERGFSYIHALQKLLAQMGEAPQTPAHFRSRRRTRMGVDCETKADVRGVDESLPNILVPDLLDFANYSLDGTLLRR